MAWAMGFSIDIDDHETSICILGGIYCREARFKATTYIHICVEAPGLTAAFFMFITKHAIVR